jgi:predicted membrane chloride channel (bestrophin family)
VTARGELFRHIGRQPLVTESWQPAWLGYVVFFAALFALRRWWWHADSFRPQPFQILSVLLTALLGFVLPTIWAFPQAWAVSWAAVISCVVQLSAVWVPASHREVTVGGHSHER